MQSESANSQHLLDLEWRLHEKHPVCCDVSGSDKPRNSAGDNRLINVVKAVPDQLDADTVFEEDANGHDP
jgi:hypothetical protein